MPFSALIRSLRQLTTSLQLFQTALAIAYLHKSGFIHGDIKGDNILVSREHTALLSDFGLARLEGIPTSEGRKGKGSVPWQSPEILNGHSKSYESDIYAFGMTIYEVCSFSHLIGYTIDQNIQVLSGKPPFSQYTFSGAMIAAIVVRDERPQKDHVRPVSRESFERLWAVAEMCWSSNARRRPTGLEVAGYLDPTQPRRLRLGRPNGIGPLPGPRFFLT